MATLCVKITLIDVYMCGIVSSPLIYRVTHPLDFDIELRSIKESPTGLRLYCSLLRPKQVEELPKMIQKNKEIKGTGHPVLCLPEIPSKMSVK